MLDLNFPEYDFRVRHEGHQSFIFDSIRKRYVTLTPEEWVRQHWLRYLVEEKKYPRSLIAVEMSLRVNRLARRCDIVVHDKSGIPRLIVECKSIDIKISQSVFDQIARYNLSLKVKYLVVSNGRASYCCSIDFEKQNYTFLPDLPDSSQIAGN
ncbi:MAG: type I restriction enzyme HsdR N-terminal domain-containing protein [Chitinophagales bacterium]|jgi:hypothetical protein|nr:type I restriction enzyme HsdR N-terminal domain-containing protein [Chitinophagales bacterium]